MTRSVQAPRVGSPTDSIAAALASVWTLGSLVERVGYVVGVLLLASGLMHLAVLAISGGSWYGPLSLRKPVSFGLSFGLTLITIVWVTSFLRVSGRLRTVLLSVFTAACALETILVTVQAWRGVPSHFNLETTFDGLVARLLAAGGVTLVAVILAFTWASFRTNTAVPVSLRIAMRFGFAALMGAVVVGALMIAKGMTLVFAGDPQAAYATGGALKPIHGVTMHAILVLPGLAWALSFADWSERRRTAAVLVASTGYLAIVGAVAAASFAHIEWQQSPALIATLGLGAAVLLGTGIMAVVAVRSARIIAER